ncbi:hypothetical protein [Pseudomonas mohnii]
MQKYKSRDDCESHREYMQQFNSVEEYIRFEQLAEWRYEREEDQKNMLSLVEPLKENNFGKWRYAETSLDDYLIAVIKTDDGEYEVMVEDKGLHYREGANISFYSNLFCNLDNGRLLKPSDFNKLQTAFLKNKILTEISKIES